MAGFNNDGPRAVLSAILFDLDNTLIETRKGDSLACRKLAEELAEEQKIPLDQTSRITNSYLKQFRKCPDNGVTNLDIWRTNLWSRALGDKFAHLAESVYKRWLRLRYRYLQLTPEVSAMLRQLRTKYLLGLVTNGPSAAQWEKIRELGLRQHFDLILVSGDLPWEKPQPEIFEEACRCLGLSLENCIMVGDKLETDILGGIEAGLAGTVWVPLNDTRLTDDDPKPNYVIKQVTDLVKILGHGPDAHEYEDSSSNASDGM